MKKQSLVKGTIILGAAGIFAKFLGIFFRIPLVMLIGDEGVGYYQMSYPLYMFIVSAATGIPVAVSKLVSERNAANDIEGSFQVLKEALKLMAFLGTGISLCLIIFGKPIVEFLKWDDKAYLSLLGVAMAPMLIYIMDAFRGFFQGQQNMNSTAVSQIIEQAGRVVCGVGLAIFLYPKGIEYSAAGAAFGAVVGGVLGNIYLILNYISFKKILNGLRIRGSAAVLNKLIKIAVPVSLGAAASSIVTLIDSALVPQKLLQGGFTQSQATVLFGQMTGKASVLINIPLTLSMALSAAIIPIIAESYSLNDKKELQNKVNTALMLSAAIALPCTLGMYFLARPILDLVFLGNTDGYLILKYQAISIPFIVIAQATTSILQASGHYIRPVINLLIACAVKVLLTIYLVPINNINIYGAVIASIIAYVTVATLNIVDVKRKLKVTMDFYKLFIRPSYASVVMIASVLFVYGRLLTLDVSARISCIASIFIGIIVYGIFIMIFGVIEYGYLVNKINNRKR